MNFSILSTLSEVDSVLHSLTDRKDDILFRTQVLLREKKEMTGTVTNIDAELAKVEARLVASQAILGVLTDSDDIRDEGLRKERLEVRRKGLVNRKEDANVVALVMLEMELEENANRISVIDAWIGQLNTRKTEISTGS